APHLGADHAERPVLDELDPVTGQRRVEGRPAAVRVELGLAAEQLVAAGATPVDTLAVLAEELTRPGPFGTRLDRKSTRLNSSHVPLHDALPICTAPRCGPCRATGPR